MPNISSRQFGLIVAFLIPGFIGLAGLAPLIPLVGKWLQPATMGELGIGPTVYTLLAGTAVGMILSCFRWLVLDHVLEWTGLPPPAIDFRQLGNQLEAFDYLSENHYRFYQFYSNSLMAILWAYTVNRAFGTSPLLGTGTDLGVLFVCLVLFLGCRDSLAKHRVRASQLLGEITGKGCAIVTNGIDHHGGGSTTRNDRPAKPQPKPRPDEKPAPTARKERESAK